MKLPKWLKVTTLIKLAGGLFYALPKFGWKRKKKAPTKDQIRAEAEAARNKIRRSN